MWAIEKSKAFDGHYHVLGGVLSAIDGIGPEELNISSLLKKVQTKKINEIILATNATVEGQITAQFIADNCEKMKFFLQKKIMDLFLIIVELEFRINQILMNACSQQITKA